MKQSKFSFIKLFELLATEKKLLWHLLIYAGIAGVILLSLPLGIQSMIGFISSGQISTSVIVLIAFILLGILVSGGLQVMQLYLVEHIQQKLFARTAFDFASRIPKMRLEALFNHNPPELMNRFFDVVSLQKGFAKLLTDFSAGVLQIVFGLLLLSLYHPYFIMFGVFLIVVLVMVIRLTGPQGMESSLSESKYKYKMANWLQEMAASIRSFKIAGRSELALEKTDELVSGYLEARKKHFNVLATQYFSFVGFKTFITGGLLVMGGVLLIQKEINIGQFVASEIIIILIMTAVEKILVKLDVVYDVLTSLEKIGQVREIPLEKEKKLQVEDLGNLEEGFSLQLKNLNYRYPSHKHDTIRNINLSVASGEKVGIMGMSNSGKTTLINLLLGLYQSYDGVISYNNVSLKEISHESLHDFTGNDSQESLFDGSILDNIKMGRSQVSLKEVLQVIEAVGLSDFVHKLDNGLETHITGGAMWLSESITQKLLLARFLVKKPRLMVLSDFPANNAEKSHKRETLRLLELEGSKPTTLFFTHDWDVLAHCDRIFYLNNGELVEADDKNKGSFYGEIPKAV